MSNANRDYAIVYDVKNSLLVLSRPLNFYLTDKNTSNIFVKLVTRVIAGDGIDQYTDIENASSYVLTMRVIKPDDEVKSIIATQHESESIFQFDLTEDFKDVPGKYICELTISNIVNGRQEFTTSDPFNYEVKRSILSNVKNIIEGKDTTVEKLLNDLDATKAELSSQIKDVENAKRDKAIKIKSSDFDISKDEYKVKLINLADEVQQAMSGNAPVNPTIPEKGITLDKLADGERYERQMGFYSDTIDMIDIQRGENENLIVNVSTKDNADAYLYRMYVNGIISSSIAIPSNTSYTVPNWHTLIYDYETSAIKCVDWNTEISKDALILLTNAKGEMKDGYFVKRYYEINNEYYRKSQNVNIYLDNPQSLYIYNAYNQFPEISESNGVYFKFDGLMHILQENISPTRRYFDGIYNQVGKINQDQSIEWVQNCIRVRENHSLVYDMYNNIFKIIHFSDIKPYYINILANRNGMVSEGKLKTIWDHECLRKIKVKENGIPTYYTNHINFKENEVIEKENGDTFNIAFTTDNHVHEHMNMATLHSHNILNKLDNSLNLVAVLNAGDTVPFGQDDKEESFRALKTGINKFRNKHKYFNAQGNHDTNAKSGVTNHKISNLISQNEIYKVLGKHLDNSVVWGDKDYMYYYKDLEKQKVRIIVLNNSDVPIEDKGDGTTTIDILETLGMRQHQVDWLANTALRFDDKVDKEEWEVILVSHYFTVIEDVHGGAEWNNRLQVHEILKAFVNGTSTTQTNPDPIFSLNVTADFTNQGAKKIIGYFCGHCHYDFMRVVDGIPFISNQADYKSDWHEACPTMTAGTYTEIAFDIVTIDKVRKNVKLTRFGAGEDREYNY